MEKSNGKTIYSSKYYFEPINKYHNLSFTDIKDLTTEKEHFMDTFLVNKNQHKIIINEGLICLCIKILHSKNRTKKCIRPIL